MKLRIVYCGRLQDVAGLREIEVEPPRHVRGVIALREWLVRDNPGLAEALRAPTVCVVVNDALARGDAPIGPDDEIAFMPPVSGG